MDDALLAYLKRRAADEQQRAESACTPQIAAIHRTMAAAYTEQITTHTAPELRWVTESDHTFKTSGKV